MRERASLWQKKRKLPSSISAQIRKSKSKPPLTTYSKTGVVPANIYVQYIVYSLHHAQGSNAFFDWRCNGARHYYGYTLLCENGYKTWRFNIPLAAFYYMHIKRAHWDGNGGRHVYNMGLNLEKRSASVCLL